MYEIAYDERKFSPNIGLEIATGYFSSDESYHDVLCDGDHLANIEIQSFFILPTFKTYIPSYDYFCFYAGAVPDLYYTELDLNYDLRRLNGGGPYSMSSNDATFGGHILVGLEFYLFADSRISNINTPLGLLVEYRYMG